MSQKTDLLRDSSCSNDTPTKQLISSRPTRPTRERTSTKSWSTPSKYPLGPPSTPNEQIFALLDATKISARALAAADDILTTQFNNPRTRLHVQPVIKEGHGLSMHQVALVKRHLDEAYKAWTDVWQPETFIKLMQSLGIVAQDHESTRAFSNLSLRYAHLKHSSRVKVSEIHMNGKVQSRIVATSHIPKKTLILELGGLMSCDAVDVVCSSQDSKQAKTHKSVEYTHFKAFSLIRRGPDQDGPGGKADRLLLGPARFVNHSCSPNCKLRPFMRTNAWGVETERDIAPDEDITVDYGKHYFEPGECACRPCEVGRASSLCTTPSTSLEASPCSPPCADTEEVRGTEVSRKRKCREIEQEGVEGTARPSKRARRGRR